MRLDLTSSTGASPALAPAPPPAPLAAVASRAPAGVDPAKAVLMACFAAAEAGQRLRAASVRSRKTLVSLVALATRLRDAAPPVTWCWAPFVYLRDTPREGQEGQGDCHVHAQQQVPTTLHTPLYSCSRLPITISVSVYLQSRSCCQQGFDSHRGTTTMNDSRLLRFAAASSRFCMCTAMALMTAGTNGGLACTQ